MHWSGTDAFARLIGWLIVEILFSRAGLWLILSAVLAAAGYAGGSALDTHAGLDGAAWLLGGIGLIGGLILFHWLLNVGSYQRYGGDLTLADLEDEAELSLHDRFLRRRK